MQKITVFVPSRTRDGASLDASRVTEETLIFLASLFGGATIQPATGGWLDAAGNVMVESVYLVFSYADGLSHDVRESVFQYCARLRDEYQQESVAVEIVDVPGEFVLV